LNSFFLYVNYSNVCDSLSGRALADVFVTIVDDWNSPGVAAGTKEAFMELGYTVVYGEVLGGGHTHSLSNVRNPWHNGLYVAVVTK
jgi:hypothetical protein